MSLRSSPAPSSGQCSPATAKWDRPLVRLHVHVDDVGVVLVTAGENDLLAQVAEGAVQRMRKLKPLAIGAEMAPKELRLAPQGPLFDFSDPVAGLLSNDEHLYVVTGLPKRTSDATSPRRSPSNEISPMTSPRRNTMPSRMRTTSACTEDELQRNLIRSHACGVGQQLTLGRVRMLLALRINVLAKGYSGISLDNLQRMIAAFNACCLSLVPQQGTVGCSGDLAQLAHLALGLMGEGYMWSPKTGWADAAAVLQANHLQPIGLSAKEGIAMINGTQMVTSLGAEVIERADSLARQADVIAALTLDILKGTTNAFDPDIHRIRPHPGQMAVAERLRSLLHDKGMNSSKIAESHRFCSRVQDAYTLRCVPQVHGVVHDTIAFARTVIDVELNAATDNPLVFADRGEIKSGGNFHGEYPAKVLDFVTIAVHELAQMSERRFERLNNPALSGLPDFLAKDGGVNSGLMMVQVTAASLVSENKVLVHPSSADSIPTSANQEDHVSMGGFAARKALMVLDNVENVLAMELMAACQGMEFLKPLTSTAPLQKVYNLVRHVSPAIEKDRYFAPDIASIARLLREQKVWQCVKQHLDECQMNGLENWDDFDTAPGSPTTTFLQNSANVESDDVINGDSETNSNVNGGEACCSASKKPKVD